MICKKCNEPMTLLYELDVPVVVGRKDTQKRDRHVGFICYDCVTSAWTKNGKDQEHGKPKRAPKGAHPRMTEILQNTLNGIAKAKKVGAL